ncbi:MAG: hypothetical protein ACTSUB_02045 [Candidatus Thorarchaeota archaeon]
MKTYTNNITMIIVTIVRKQLPVDIDRFGADDAIAGVYADSIRGVAEPGVFLRRTFTATPDSTWRFMFIPQD